MPRDRDALYDILDACRLILEYTEGMGYESFRASQMIKDAVLRRFEIIGEATNRLSAEFCQRHPDVPWQDMAGMRDRVIHGYDAVDWQIVWKAVHESVPELAKRLETILAEFEDRPKNE
jgi:uncharacterized protein with HEPN domain